MSSNPVQASLLAIRRLAVTKQHLAGGRPAKASGDGTLSVVRDLAFIQWDPIEVVAPSHVLSLWSRLDGFRPSDLDMLLWKDKTLFEHWANFVACLVLTEDYPIYHSMMRRYPDSLGDSWGRQREDARRFISSHRTLARSLLKQLEKGPLRLDQFLEYKPTKRSDDGWTPGSQVSEALFHLHMGGEVMVVGHEGNRNVWGLSRRFLPEWVDRSELTAEETERATALRAIRAVGTASAREINVYFPRGRYLDLKGALEGLVADSTIRLVRVEGLKDRAKRYVHADDLGLLAALEEDFEPRLSLVPPFDNLISGRTRTNTVFGFDYSHEMFLPEGRRKYGYYVLPIVWGERIIGRVDPVMDRLKEKLVVNSVHAESGAPTDKEVASKIGERIWKLAEFLGAKDVEYSSRVPSAWHGSLR